LSPGFIFWPFSTIAENDYCSERDQLSIKFFTPLLFSAFAENSQFNENTFPEPGAQHCPVLGLEEIRIRNKEKIGTSVEASSDKQITYH